MNTIYLIIFFIFGASMGSFYGVIGERLPRNESFIKGRSHCNSCHHTLHFLDLIPILSYIINKGKCRYCKKDIPVMLPILELTTGLLYSVSFYSYGLSLDLLIALGVVSLLMIVMVSDLLYYIIPDEVIIFFSFYFIIIEYLKLGFNGVCNHIVTGFFLFLLMYLIMLMGSLFFKKESLGGGDVKLLFIFGLVLEPILGVLTIFIGSLIALPVALYILYKNKEHMIPFGPFLIVSFALIYFSKLTTDGFLRFITFNQ